jgi:hypothetical protein
MAEQQVVEFIRGTLLRLIRQIENSSGGIDNLDGISYRLDWLYNSHFRQGLNLKKETQLGMFELRPVKKEGFNSKSLKILDAQVKPRHLRHVKEQIFESSTI